MGLERNFFAEGDATLEEQNGIITVKNRTVAHSSLGVNVPEYEYGKTRFLIKLADGAKDVCITLYHRVKYEYNGRTVTDYDGGTKKKITHNEWTWIEGTYCTPAGADEITAYFIQDKETPLCDVLLKEITVEEIKKEEALTEIKEQPFTVGAIRWDAYFSTAHPVRNVSREVAKALSPAEFHFRAPFFANVNGDGKIEFPEETQEQFDKEAQLAIDAGIDYFAYCWYSEGDVMRYARKRHSASSLRNKIKMAAIVHVTQLDDETLKDLAKTVKEDFYVKFDGHPLIYVFDAIRTDVEYRKRIDSFIVNEGSLTPYFVGMNAQPQPYALYKLKNEGFDAIGSYGFNSLCEGEEFSSYARRNREMVKMRYEMGFQNVPLLSLGHDYRPRIKNPVSWMGGKNYAFAATADEIYEHSREMLKIKNQYQSGPNTLLIYAWNEHDEGGWMCPTITDDGYYQAVKKAIKDVK